MKSRLQKVLPVLCAMGLFLACSLTVCAGDLPSISAQVKEVSVSHEDKSETVKVKVKNWKGASGYAVKYAIDDPSIAKVELSSQKSDYFKLKIKAKGTGTTVIKVWLDGYSRVCDYIVVDSINYQKDDEDGYSIRHYGYMTGEKGEAAAIEDFEIETEDGEDKLCVYFTFKDKGAGTGDNVVFSIKCEEDDGDVIGMQKATASGMTAGGSGYKVYFKLPAKTSIIKITNNDL